MSDSARKSQTLEEVNPSEHRWEMLQHASHDKGNWKQPDKVHGGESGPKSGCFKSKEQAASWEKRTEEVIWSWGWTPVEVRWKHRQVSVSFQLGRRISSPLTWRRSRQRSLVRSSYQCPDGETQLKGRSASSRERRDG
jgi:hypothetical protein